MADNNISSKIEKYKKLFEDFSKYDNYKKMAGDIVTGKIDFDIPFFKIEFYNNREERDIINVEKFISFSSDRRISNILEINYNKTLTVKVRISTKFFPSIFDREEKIAEISDVDEIKRILDELAKSLELFKTKYLPEINKKINDMEEEYGFNIE